MSSGGRGFEGICGCSRSLGPDRLMGADLGWDLCSEARPFHAAPWLSLCQRFPTGRRKTHLHPSPTDGGGDPMRMGGCWEDVAKGPLPHL